MRVTVLIGVATAALLTSGSAYADVLNLTCHYTDGYTVDHFWVDFNQDSVAYLNSDDDQLYGAREVKISDKVIAFRNRTGRYVVNRRTGDVQLHNYLGYNWTGRCEVSHDPLPNGENKF